jgi:hypothetical protein
LLFRRNKGVGKMSSRQKKFITIIEEGNSLYERKYCKTCGRPIWDANEINCSSCRELIKKIEDGLN